MSDGTYLGLWLDEVFRTPHVSPEVQVFLLLLGRYMDNNGSVSERTVDLATALGCTERRIASKFATAISSGFLERTSRGQKGRTAAYRAVLPGVQGDDSRQAEVDVQGDDSRQAEPSQGDGERQAEAKVQGASRRHPERPRVDVQGDDSRQAEPAPPYEDRAHALSRDHLSQSTEQLGDVAETPAAIVVALFEGRSEMQVQKNTPSKRETPDLFGEFWKIYPRKVSKANARKAWDKAIKSGADPEEIVLGARTYASCPRRRESDIQFTAHPATWLNGERWEDAPEPAPSAPAARPTNLYIEQGAGERLGMSVFG